MKSKATEGKNPPIIRPVWEAVMKSSYSSLDETIKDLSEHIPCLEPLDYIFDGEEIKHTESISEDDDDINKESDEEEIEDEHTDEEESFLDKDFSRSFYIGPPHYELEIVKDSEGFKVIVHTSEKTPQLGIDNTIGDINMKNAANTVLQALTARERNIYLIGQHIASELKDYLNNLSDKDRHWYLKPLMMKNIKGIDVTTASRLKKGLLIKLPNGEVENVRDFFDKSKMPVSNKCIVIEVGRLLEEDMKITNEEIRRRLIVKAKDKGFDLVISEAMIRHWRNESGLTRKKLRGDSND